MMVFPMLIVSDVEASSAFYQRLFGLKSAHGGPYFEQLTLEGETQLCLHHPEIEEHPIVRDPRSIEPGAGVLLYYSVDDVQSVYARAVEMKADLFDEPHHNELAHTIEFSLRDPDGYAWTVAQPTG
ncbi:MAG: VOC family protein [Gemmatimonadota bacterium]